MATSTSNAVAKTKKPRRVAGAFDIRNVIGMLLAIYGFIVLLSGFLLDPGIDPSDGTIKNAGYNIWAGVALLIVAAVFMGWAYFKPIVVPVNPENPGPANTNPANEV